MELEMHQNYTTSFEFHVSGLVNYTKIFTIRLLNWEKYGFPISSSINNP